MPSSLFEILFLLIAEQHLEQGVCVLDKAFFKVTMWYDKKRIQRKAMRGRQGQSWCGFIRITVITKVFSSTMYVGAQSFIEDLKYITCTPENADSKFSTGRKVWGPDAIASWAVMLPDCHGSFLCSCASCSNSLSGVKPPKATFRNGSTAKQLDPSNSFVGSRRLKAG